VAPATGGLASLARPCPPRNLRTLFLWWSIMSDALKEAAHYRDLEKRYVHLAAIGSSTERRNYYLRIAEHYSTLAEAEELRTPEHVNSK
jgi:hypothetical protein